MSSSSPHPKKSNGEHRRSKKTASDSESDSEEYAKPAGSTPAPGLEKSSTIMKEIKATFDFKGPKDFQKIRILGKGGVGRVYLVQLKGSDKLFAMKVLKQEEMISRNKVKRVLTEREVLATTKHPLIISLYYSFQSRSRLYFVMDYCAGGEFYRTIQMQPQKCLTEEQMRFYAAEVLLALEYLHAMGFVYRDLKPENILLHASGHIRLTDFDLSKASVTPVNAHVVQSMMGSPTMVAEPTLVTNSFVGTEEYLAPEVIVGKGYGASVDWWTFGILMFEMLYGVTPFRGKSQQDTFSKIDKTQVKFPDHARGPVSKECKSLIKKLLTHDPKKRLGYEQGAAEIKAHPFFKDVNLQLILNSKPPIIPDLAGPNDFKYFSSRIVDDDKDDEDMEFVSPEELDDDHPFKSFVPVDREMDSKTRAAAAAAAAAASSSSHKPFKKSSRHDKDKSSSSSLPTTKRGGSSSTLLTASNTGSSDDLGTGHRKSKSHSRKNSGSGDPTLGITITTLNSATKLAQASSDDEEDDGHRKSHHHHHHHAHDATTSSEGDAVPNSGRDSPASLTHHKDRDHHHHHHHVTGEKRHSSRHHSPASASAEHSAGSDHEEDGHAAGAHEPALQVPQPIRRKKTPTHVHPTSASAGPDLMLGPSTHVPKSRPRPPEEDDLSEEDTHRHSKTSKVPRSRTPHPDEDTYTPSPVTKTKHSSRHMTPTSDTADDEDHPHPTKPSKKSSTHIKGSDGAHHSPSSSTSHSRHSSSKRSTTPEPGDSGSGIDDSVTPPPGGKSDSSKSIKKVPSNLSDELEGVSIAKTSSKRGLTPSTDDDSHGTSSKSSSRRGTPTSSKKQHHD